jgi:hypothetical protein
MSEIYVSAYGMSVKAIADIEHYYACWQSIKSYVMERILMVRVFVILEPMLEGLRIASFRIICRI